MTRPPGEPSDTFSHLKDEFERCRSLTERAQSRAVRAAQEAVALRSLSRARLNSAALSPDERKQWAAATRAIAEMARERDRVLGTVSHEMRQSLAAALAAERVLVHHRDTPPAAKAADVLDRQLLHLSRLVELLLDYSRLMIGAAELTSEAIDIRALLRQVVEECAPLAEDKQIDISMSLCPHAQVLRGDETRLRQLVSNLLHNALRYTPPGGSVRFASATVDNAAHLTVADDGAGIAADDLPRIFEPFTRGTSDGPGLGIGLALARRIAQLHGGSIEAASEGPGRGSTFTVVLPLAPPTR